MNVRSIVMRFRLDPGIRAARRQSFVRAMRIGLTAFEDTSSTLLGWSQNAARPFGKIRPRSRALPQAEAPKTSMPQQGLSRSRAAVHGSEERGLPEVSKPTRPTIPLRGLCYQSEGGAAKGTPGRSPAVAREQ